MKQTPTLSATRATTPAPVSNETSTCPTLPPHTDRIHLLAADLAARVPAMMADSAINNADLIERLIRNAINKD